LKVLDFSKEIIFLIDTGADVTCISIQCIPGKFRNKIIPSDKIIFGPDGRKLSVAGYFNLKIKKDDSISQSKVYVLYELNTICSVNRKF